MSDIITPEAARHILWNQGILHWMLHTGQKSMYDSYYDCKEKIVVWNCSRRLGKCLEKGTKILTPTGHVNIEDIKIGDTVYGYNEDGSVSETKVTNTFIQGEKEVFPLLSSNKKIAGSTKDHVWLTNQRSCPGFKERKLEDFYSGIRIVRKFVKIPCGKINEPHAYAIGALLGDGCARQGKQVIYISSSDDQVPKKCSEILGTNYYRNSLNNYTYCLSYERYKEANSHNRKKVNCNYYDEWMRGRYAHEKIVDINVIKNWDRETCLNFLAGLIDTDGSVSHCQNRLNITYCSQSKSIIDAFIYLFYKLFQYEINFCVDGRGSDKYVNGDLYMACCSNNLFSKRALKELSPYLAKDKKKWKEIYESCLENNTNPDFMGVKLGKSYKAQTYDIEVNNKTHLYLTSYGLVTHNSWTLCTLAIEECLKKPNSLVKYCCAKQNDAKNIIRPLIREIIQTCPKELKPEYRAYEKTYIFPNGSRIELYGLDAGRAESIRGGSSTLAIVDEAGLVGDLKYIIRSIILPTTTTTKGKIILASTPPVSGDHEFVYFLRKAEAEGNLITKTIYENPKIDQTELQKIIEECGGITSSDFRREYLCEIIIDLNKAVVPEFTFELESKIVRTWDRPPFYDTYVAMDLGLKDLTVALFAYYDFRNDKVIIEDEFVINGQKFNTNALAAGIRLKEDQCFGDPFTGEKKEPFLRVSDNNLIVINDLYHLHGLRFLPTKKDNSDAALNNMRMMLEAERIIINPKCKTLISHLKSATWNKNKDSFSRSSDGSHADAIDACKYLIRNVMFTKNPYPPNWGMASREHQFDYNKPQKHANANQYNKIFNLKK